MDFIKTESLQHFKKYYAKTIYTVVTLMLAIRLWNSFNGDNNKLYWIVIFLLFALSAEYYRENKIKKYIFTTLSFMVIVVSVAIFRVDFENFSHMSFFLIPVYSYLLRDIVFINIVSVILISLNISYGGQIEQSIIINKVIGLLSATISFSIIINLLNKLETERDKFHQLSITDPLTGLSTYEHAVDVAENILRRGTHIQIILFDVDNFKLVNDTYGHSSGNKVLVQIAETIKSHTKDLKGVASRLGGDEFILFFEDNLNTQTVVSNLLECLRDTKFVTDIDMEGVNILFSTGKVLSKDHQLDTVEDLVNKADMDMYNNKYKMKNFIDEKLKHIDTFINGEILQLLDSLREKDMYTYVHSQYTAQYAMEIAKRMALDKNKIDEIYIAGLLHDIGKLLISNNVLRNPNRLNEKEFAIVREHVKYGIYILDSMKLSTVVKNGLLYHHERWDGTGYPGGLQGKKTPIEGRILQVADAYSAMTIKRLYRKKISNRYAILELQKNKGTQFDPIVVDVLSNIMEEIEIEKMA